MSSLGTWEAGGPRSSISVLLKPTKHSTCLGQRLMLAVDVLRAKAASPLSASRSGCSQVVVEDLHM